MPQVNTANVPADMQGLFTGRYIVWVRRVCERNETGPRAFLWFEDVIISRTPNWPGSCDTILADDNGAVERGRFAKFSCIAGRGFESLATGLNISIYSRQSKRPSCTERSTCVEQPKSTKSGPTLGGALACANTMVRLPSDREGSCAARRALRI